MNTLNFLAWIKSGAVVRLQTSADQVVIGGTTPHASAVVDIQSTTKGFLPPRMLASQKTAIPSPATGLILFDTNANQPQYNSGTPASPTWTSMVGGAGGSGITQLTPGAAGTPAAPGTPSGTSGLIFTPNPIVSGAGGTLAIANPFVTVLTPIGQGLSGGGSVNLGSSVTLSIPLGGVAVNMLATSTLNVNAGAGLTGGGAVALGGATTLLLPNVGPGGGPYTNATISLDQWGRVTSAASGSSGGGVTSITAGTGLTATPANPIVNTGTLSLANIAGITPNVDFANATVRVNAQGQVIALAAGTGGTGTGVTAVNPGTPGTQSGSSGLTFNPPGGIGSGVTGTVALANTGVAAGTYISPTFTVDAQGRIVSTAAGLWQRNTSIAPAVLLPTTATDGLTIGAYQSSFSPGTALLINLANASAFGQALYIRNNATGADLFGILSDGKAGFFANVATIGARSGVTINTNPLNLIGQTGYPVEISSYATPANLDTAPAFVFPVKVGGTVYNMPLYGNSVSVRARATISVEEKGAVGNGTTDDSGAFNAAANALGANGGVIECNSPSYGIGAPLDGRTARNIRLVGANGQPILKKLVAGASASFCHSDWGQYRGWSFENLQFDGNRAATMAANLPGSTMHFVSAQDMRFERCLFRDFNNMLLAGAHRMLFDQCFMLGTRPGTMTAGQNDPAANASASFGTGITVSSGCVDIQFHRSRFQFVQFGISGNITRWARSRGLRIFGCDFRNDWFWSPYVIQKNTIAAYSGNPQRKVTVTGANFTGQFVDLEIVCIPVVVGSGSAFTAINQGVVQVSGGFNAIGARVGDVIELLDGSGRRAEITFVVPHNDELGNALGTQFNPDAAWIADWETVDTFEPADLPASLSIPWRLMRVYSAMGTRDTGPTTPDATNQFTLLTEPVNVFTGSTISGDGVNIVGLTYRKLAKTGYGGVQISGGQEGLQVECCRFRGSWADQLSVFDCPAVQMIGNDIRYGEDEGITCTENPGSVVTGNRILNQGTSALFVSNAGPGNCVIANNSWQGWGLTNRAIMGGLEIACKGASVTGNTAYVDPTANYGGASPYMIAMLGDCTGSIFSGNVNIGARLGPYYADLNGAPAPNAVRIYGTGPVAGPGAANVNVV